MNLRFLISWLVAAVVMYLAFYVWHGLVLDDLRHISYSRSLFYIFAACAYLVIAFLLFKIFEFKPLKKILPGPFIRGLASGFIVGMSVFMITRVADVGIGTSVTMKHLVLDASWQIVEQAAGGIIMTLGQYFIYDPVLEQEAINAKNQ